MKFLGIYFVYLGTIITLSFLIITLFSLMMPYVFGIVSGVMFIIIGCIIIKYSPDFEETNTLE